MFGNFGECDELAADSSSSVSYARYTGGIDDGSDGIVFAII